jgi:hypothetical protein
MKKTKRKWKYVWYGVALLVPLIGCLASGLLIASGLGAYPELISGAYEDDRVEVEVPGKADLELTRIGAYGIYYQGLLGAYAHAEWPPNIECSLASQDSGRSIPVVPDFVPTNRYETQEGETGVLVFSTTIEEPGSYSLACDFIDGPVGAKALVSIGPNYFFEFLRTSWNLVKVLLKPVGILCGSAVVFLGVAIAIIVRELVLNRSRPEDT